MKVILPLFRKVWEQIKDIEDAPIYFKEVKSKKSLPKDRIAIQITVYNDEAFKQVIDIFYNAGYQKHKKDFVLCA